MAELQQLITTTLELPPPPLTVSSVGPDRDVVVPLPQAGVAGTASWQRVRERGATGTLSSVYRFLDRLAPSHPQATVRVERAPGSEAHVDFGDAGLRRDPRAGALRKTRAFVMGLASSRRQYVEFVFDQALPTWMRLHGHVFTFAPYGSGRARPAETLACHTR